jgi:hypothetical protein
MELRRKNISNSSPTPVSLTEVRSIFYLSYGYAESKEAMIFFSSETNTSHFPIWYNYCIKYFYNMLKAVLVYKTHYLKI